MAYSPDGKTLVSGGIDRLDLPDVSFGRHSLGAGGGVPKADSAVAFAPDGQLVVSGGLDGTIRFWDWVTGRELRRCEGVGHRGHEPHIGVVNLAYAPDGKTLVSADAQFSQPPFCLWDTATAKHLNRFGDREVGSPIAFAPTANRC